MMLTQENTQLIDVAIPLPIDDPYTYRVTGDLAGRIQVGCRVRVPFRNRTIVGYTVGLDSSEPAERTKEILELLDPKPVLSDHFLRLTKWISEYYFSSWGEAISNVIPKFLKAASDTHATKEKPQETPRLIRLNDEQEQALLKIKDLIAARRFSEVFLFGVTGGGKSELYIRAIMETLKQGRSVICLVPEIALTEQLKLFFIQHFKNHLEILHSKLGDRERSAAWHRIQQEEKRVILGARSAIFAPTPNLGLIVIDEEQEGSYKQDQVPRYHAREVARWRARDLGALFIIGTATPTLETMYRASNGEIEMLTLSKRVDNKTMPEVRMIDLKQADEIAKRMTIISPSLKIAIEEALRAKSGVLLMLNRRGFSTQIRCLKCSHVFFCPHCAVALTFHQEDQQVLCHYCNYHMTVPRLCTQCGHLLFKFSGIGTEKVESEIARVFPKARIARLDTDATKKRGSHEEIITKFRGREIDILIGTQMIAKGFDFRHVTVVGIINADTGLLLPDFRSAERTFQLLTQMAGRAGRGSEKGNVLIQTYSPGHYAIQFAAKHDYQGFFSEEIERRRLLRYPPFARLVNLMFRGKIEHLVREQSFQFRKLLEMEPVDSNIELIGPAPLPLYRLRGHYRWHLMLRSSDMEAMQARLRSSLKQFKRKAGIYLAIDVDPISIL